MLRILGSSQSEGFSIFFSRSVFDLLPIHSTPMITYNAQSTLFPRLDQSATTAWLTRVAQHYGRRIGQVNYIFCTDAEILDINRRYIGHDYYTDHIGFDYSRGDLLSADIYIGLETVRSNARLYADPATPPDAALDAEFHRVLAHGLLHLVGIDDATPEERAQMQAAEDEALRMWAQ